jgi:hypothetical protein
MAPCRADPQTIFFRGSLEISMNCSRNSRWIELLRAARAACPTAERFRAGSRHRPADDRPMSSGPGMHGGEKAKSMRHESSVLCWFGGAPHWNSSASEFE